MSDNETVRKADACLDAMLQCIYHAPLAHEHRQHAFLQCHRLGASCYASVFEPASPTNQPGGRNDEAVIDAINPFESLSA
jgi:hypothetical protein